MEEVIYRMKTMGADSKNNTIMVEIEDDATLMFLNWLSIQNCDILIQPFYGGFTGRYPPVDITGIIISDVDRMMSNMSIKEKGYFKINNKLVAVSLIPAIRRMGPSVNAGVYLCSLQIMLQNYIVQIHIVK